MYARLCQCYVITFVFCTAHEHLCTGFLVYNKWSSVCFCDLPQSASISPKTLQYFFSTRANLQLLGCSDILYADGTSNICPRLFYQMLTIHAFKHGKQFPLAYFLLPGKSREVYNTAFTLLNEATQTHLPIQPSCFHN